MTNSKSAIKPEIKLVDLTKTYQMGEVKVQVLRDIDLEIYKGELSVILGPSGSGKSTLLNMIGGIDRPTSGKVLFDENDIATYSDSKLTEYRRSNVGFVFQFYNLVPTLTARENVQVSTEICDNPMDPDEALQHVGLGDRMDHFPAQMSGGQQQRVAIARALAKNPRLMLCDEPTGALDTETSVIVLNLLTKLNKELNTTLVLITHAPPIARMAHRIISIDSGKVETTQINKKRIKAEEIVW
ncbi:MAG: ABC transporter ATP-binding protein [Candidatus Theseobacter exili]|nr:ABC transporter ATP-binding protein [Candidatus Theseobacter exili]